jgi:hypothetical protein
MVPETSMASDTKVTSIVRFPSVSDGCEAFFSGSRSGNVTTGKRRASLSKHYPVATLRLLNMRRPGISWDTC